MPRLYTSYWKNEALALPPHDKALKVGISRGGPRRRMPYKYLMLREEPFAPSRRLLTWWRRPGVRTSEDAEVYERAYLLQLETAGVEEISAQLERKVAGVHDTSMRRPCLSSRRGGFEIVLEEPRRSRPYSYASIRTGVGPAFSGGPVHDGVRPDLL